MNTKNKEKSVEERLDDIGDWQKRIEDKLREDLIGYKEDYMEAPGTYAPNINEQRYIDPFSKDYSESNYKTEFHYRLDMNNAKYDNVILNEDYINDLIEDSLKITQLPESTKLIDNELATELKSLASIIKSCERFIKTNPDTVVAFKDGLMALRRQYEEAMSHLKQASRLPISDFLTNEAILRYNLKKFKEAVKETSEMAYDFTYNFKELTADFIEWE